MIKAENPIHTATILIPEPARQGHLQFDPNKIVGEKHFQLLKKDAPLERLATLKILLPDRAWELDIDEIRARHPQAELDERPFAAKILLEPESFEDYDAGGIWNKSFIENNFISAFLDRDIDKLFDAALDLRVLYDSSPDDIRVNIDLREIRPLLRSTIANAGITDCNDIATAAASLCLIDGPGAARLDKTMWGWLCFNLDILAISTNLPLADDRFRLFTRRLLQMGILAASDIVFDPESGLTLTFNNPVTNAGEEPTQLPVIRKFAL